MSFDGESEGLAELTPELTDRDLPAADIADFGRDLRLPVAVFFVL